MRARMNATNEAEHHWQESITEIQEALAHAERTEMFGRTVAVRRSAAQAIQRFNRQLAVLMDHHPVLCACRPDGPEARQGCNTVPEFAA